MQLSIITVGHVHTDALAALTNHFTRLEQVVVDLPPDASVERHRADFNRAVDAAANDWILLLREREILDPPLAQEIAEAAAAAKAWGFRIRSVPFYCGRPLRLGVPDGDLRLFHRRHLLRRGPLAVQGTVVRLRGSLRSVSFESTDEHRAHLLRTEVPHSGLRTLLVFLKHGLAARTLDGNTLRYLWIEASFDSGGKRSPR
ncbi:MAG TPA: hypothetical protein VFL80_11860 [Thermoanaerobaculia bacterium]|nr:hypothetical protein [Thermoanaerobaculia bacterium]